MVERIHALWPSMVLIAGLEMVRWSAMIFDGTPRWQTVFATLGGLLIFVAFAARTVEWRTVDAGAPAIEMARRPTMFNLWLGSLGVVVAMVLYAITRLALTGDDASTEGLRGILTFAWVIVLICSLLPTAFIELAVLPVAHIDRYELSHVRHAARRGLALALFLCCLFVANFLAVRHDRKFELAEDSTAKPSTQTQSYVRGLTSEVRVVLFYPKANEVGDRLEQYFRPLQALNENLRVERTDQALALELARGAKVTENGAVALYHDKSDDVVKVGTELRSARSKLKRFDTDFLKAMLRVTVGEKIAYFYNGHDERPWVNPRKDDKRPPLNKLRRQLQAWRYKIQPFGIAEGSTEALPDDGDVMFIMGPEKPFLESEIEAIKSGLRRGARLFIALEAERTGDDLAGLLEPLGLTFDKTPLAAPSSNLPVTRTARDQSFMYSNAFSSHPSVTTMTRNSRKVVALFYKPGSLEKKGKPTDGVKADIVLTAPRDVFADANDNLKLDEGERKDKFGLAAAVTVTSTSTKKGEEGRAFLLADADAMADDMFDLLPGNRYFLRDAILWLQRQPEVIVPTPKETDVKIIHKGAEDSLIFYGTTLAVPILVLIAGAFATRRRRQS